MSELENRNSCRSYNNASISNIFANNPTAVSPVSEANQNMLDDCECRNKIMEDMLMQIKALKFSITECALYLDTHPDDQKALCLHREYCKQLKDLEDKYQKMFGPLSIYCPCNKWRWLEEPWPWERGSY